MIGASARRAPQWAALAVAALAAVLLTVTVGVTARSVEGAGETLIRGEGEAILRGLAEAPLAGPDVRTADLERALATRRDVGLRYLAIAEPEADVVVEAGEAQLTAPAPFRPGSLIVRDGRARLTQPLLGGPPGGPGRPPHPPPGAPSPGRERPPPPWEAPTHEGQPLRAGPPPLVVIEFEPKLLAGLEASMARARIVAAMAAVVLLVVAGVVGRSLARAAEAERRGERERRLVALGEMSAVMAHELRNPLASLKGHAQLLAENLDEGSRSRAKAELVVSEAERLERLTRALLDFVREAPLEPHPVALGDVVTRTLADFPADRLTVTLEDPAARVDVDEARLRVALGNLVRNALESDPAGVVEVRVSRSERLARIEVRDHGPGLPATEGARIFEPFVTTRVKGTGLGLAVARRAVEQHGGTLVGDNAPGGGARLCISLPLAQGGDE